ncbi:MAG: carboxypeptidase regulatory-like domain-containing protein [Planctomycetes bacterium]|nr:carboxypeptidase regulatory-like domain-containing protein [Planctomycetota bacterium]
MNPGMRALIALLAVVAVGVGVWTWAPADALDAAETSSRNGRTDAAPTAPSDVRSSANRAAADEAQADAAGRADAIRAADRVALEPALAGDSAGATAILEGRVVDDGGRPIAGASVVLLRVGVGLIAVREPLGATARTNGAGRYAFDGVPSTTPLAVEASAAGHTATRSGDLVTRAGATLDVPDLVLSTGVRVTGRVRSTADGRPVPAARVAARLVRGGVPADPLGRPIETRSDAQGDYRLDGLGPETYRFDVSAPDFVDTTIDRSFFAARTRKEAAFDLSLEPSAGSLLGSARDESGTPLADVTIVATATRKPGVTHRVEARSDGDGAFALGALGPWEYTIDASATHHALTAPVVARTVDRTLELTLLRKARLSGTVRFESGSGQARIDAALVPRPGATPSLFAQVRVAADGSFVIEDVPSGDIVLDVASDVGAPTRFGPVAVVAGSNVTGIELTVTRGSVARGRVLRPDGGPAADASVVLLPASFDVGANDASLVLLEGTQRKNTRCAADGSFELAGLPDGSFRVRASVPGFAPAHSATFAAGSAPDIDVGSLRLTPQSTIGGRVVDALGNGVARAIVRASSAAGIAGGVTASDADGQFRFDGLEAGTWTIRAARAHGQLGALDEVGDAVVDVEPSKPATVTIRVARQE